MLLRRWESLKGSFGDERGRMTITRPCPKPRPAGSIPLSRRFVLIAVAAVVVLSVGCSSGDDAVANTTSSSVWTPTSSTVAGTPSGAGNADDGVVSMPLDAYQGIDDAEDVVGAAQERLIADCMTKIGRAHV